MINLVICDLDGFLVETWGTTPLSGVEEALAELRRRKIPVAVATNQAGPLWQVVLKDKTKYPSSEMVAERLLTCAHLLSLQDAFWIISMWDDRLIEKRSHSVLQWLEGPQGVSEKLYQALYIGGLELCAVLVEDYYRKPNPGMLLLACSAWELKPEEVVYGGDRDIDRQAAEAAGIRFVEKLSDVLTLLEGEQ